MYIVFSNDTPHDTAHDTSITPATASPPLCIVECLPDGTIISANDAFLDMTGYARQDLIGQAHGAVLSGSSAQGLDPALWDGLGAGAFQKIEHRAQAKDGSTLLLRSTFNPVLDAYGSVFKVIHFMTHARAAPLSLVR